MISFNIVAYVTMILWLAGCLFIVFGKKGNILTISGNIMVFAGALLLIAYLVILWINLERPPLRILGETRLWYAVLLPVVGIAIYLRHGYKWFLYYSLFMASVFLVINITKPENFDNTLMPALQSPWFVPHVIVYMISYALLGASSYVAARGLYFQYYRQPKPESLKISDNIIFTGFAFLTLGLVFGALWAKEAWGHYWTWDPKETWAMLTWLSYLIYIHFRYRHPQKTTSALWIIALAFVVLLICWLGINYLSVAENSVHTYSGQ